MSLHDVFLSYARADLQTALEWERELVARGLTVWRDEPELRMFDNIAASIRNGLARSCVLVAIYTQNYGQRRYCQWELTTALSADAARVLVVDAENEGTDHIWPLSLRERRLAGADPKSEAAEIQRAVNRLQGPIPLANRAVSAPWLGIERAGGSNRFVGRLNDLWEIDDGLWVDNVALAAAAGRPAGGYGVVQVRGLGGAGKTLLAEEYARRFSVRHPGGVFRVRLGNDPATMARRRSDFLRELAMLFDVNSEKLDSEALFAQLKRALPEKPYLWIVDDLPEGIADCGDWIAPTDWGRTIITTRDRRHESLGRKIDLDSLADEDAVALLTRDTQLDSIETEAAKSIVAELGRHALAVDLAGALREAKIFPDFASLLDDLRDPDEDAIALAVALAEELPNGYERNISHMLLKSLERFVARPEIDALRLAARLAPGAPVPMALFAAEWTLSAAHARRRSTARAAALGLNRLAAASLCRVDDRAYEVHPILCRVINHYFDRSIGAAIEARAAMRIVDELKRAEDRAAHAEILPYAPHAAWLAGRGDGANEGVLWHWLGRLSYVRGDYAAAAAACERAAALRARFNGEDHFETLASRNDLAASLVETDAAERALLMQRGVVQRAKELFESNDPRTLTFIANLAVYQLALGHAEEAKVSVDAVLSARVARGFDGNASLLAALSNLGAILYDLDETETASQVLTEALAASRETLGPDTDVTLSLMNNLSATLNAVGRHEAAAALAAEVAESRLRRLGETHPETLTSLNNLADALVQSDRLDEALALHLDVMAKRKRRLGPANAATLTSMNNASALLYRKGALSEARALQQQVLKARRSTLGESHPLTLTAQNNLAVTLRAGGLFGEAVTLHRDELEKCIAARGETHAETLTSMTNFALALQQDNQLVEARFWARRATIFRARRFGLRRNETLAALNNLATIHGAMGELRKALAGHGLVLRLRREILPAEHQDILISMSNYGGALYDAGEFVAALELQKEELALCRRRMGAEHEELLPSLCNTALTLAALKRTAEERILLEEARKLGETFLQPEHPYLTAIIDRLRRLSNFPPESLDN